MAIKNQPSDSHGSLKQLQTLVNNYVELINNPIKERFKNLSDEKIIWKSPLAEDDFAEYTDDDFVEKIGLEPDEIKLQEFWPRRGANWDALATTDKNKIILVEAKANIPELVSPPSGAGKASMKLIAKSLNETKDYLNKKDEVDWAGKFYQYTNRVAHLYFLREQRGKEVFLVNIYFIGDTSVDGPTTKEEWKGAIEVMKRYLGLNSHKLQKYMADIFIDITKMNGSVN